MMTPETEPAKSSSRTRAGTALCIALALAVLAVIAIGYAEPFLDGDLFFHMAYAKQMLARGTLQLDHTTFSWTPTSNRMIYCAWASELILYELWEHAGAWSLFALRYAVIVVATALLWDFARRLKLARWPGTYFILLVAVFTQYAGTLIKPELFSLLFMNLVVRAYFRGKEAAHENRSPVLSFYLVPALIALWVNFHGAFILAAPFLIAIAAGEGLNLIFSRGAALSARDYRHLLFAWALGGAATILNPYGWRYPAQLFEDNALGRTSRPDTIWNAAHKSVFAASSGQSGLTLVHLMAIIIALLAGVFALRMVVSPRGSRIDFASVLANLACIPLFIALVRGTSFWAPVFAYSFLFAAARVRERASNLGKIKLAGPGWNGAVSVAAVAAFAIMAGMAWFGVWRHPQQRAWVGFGISYWNPVPEAEFLAASKLGPRIINLFDSGAYLLWRLSPTYQVMTDQRSFPYLSWFDEQYKFSNGGIFEEFLASHPADVAVIDLEKEAVWRQFVQSRAWRLVYYGPTAAVFVRESVKQERLASGVAQERFDHLLNAQVGGRIFQFACTVGDFRTAWKVAAQLETTLAIQTSAKGLHAVLEYREAHRALRAEDFNRASRLFRSALDHQRLNDRDRLILTFLDAWEAAQQKGAFENTDAIRAGLRRLAAPE